MNGLIRASLRNPYAVTVTVFTILVLGILCLTQIPFDILPVFKSPAVQVLTFYGGMPARGIEKDITNRMERWTGQSNGIRLQESRSIVGASIVRNYFHDDVDPNGALTQVNSLALSVMPNLPPGTLPPVVLPFDPTSTVPVSLVALDSKTETESILYDVGRYEVRNMIMSNPGASAPVVFGGKLRAVMLYLDRIKMQARGLSPVDVMRAADEFNVFVPSGDVKIGELDFALMSNSMYEYVGGSEGMGSIPLKAQHGNAEYLRDVASSEDAAFIQTNVVRVNGRRQVYIPVYRQLGASTLKVVAKLKDTLPDMQARLTRPGIALKLVMDQSIYVRSSIAALAQEGALGSILCSLVILVFLGEWRMTLIAIMTLPLSVLSAIICLYYTGNTVNVMTLGGLALAIGPMVDSAIICLENTHRHLSLGARPQEAAFLGASEVAMPELVATLCTFLVLAPLAMMPGIGQFLFRPMALAVAFAMVTAYLLSRSLVPAFSALWLRGHAHDDGDAHAEPAKPRGPLGRAFAQWEALIERGISLYVRGLTVALNHRVLTAAIAFSLLVGTLAVFGPRLRRDFFPEVDAGAFEIFARAPAGRRIEVTEGLIQQIEDFIREKIPAHDLELYISEIGVTPDWSAAYTPNAGPMDAVVKVQLTEHRTHSSQEYIGVLREGFAADSRFSQLDFAFDAGGMVRGALNEGKSTPINIRITGNKQDVVFNVGERIRDEAKQINGVVDARVLQRMNAPAYIIEVDRAKAADLGLTQADIMQNVIASTNSSISFNKKNFWIDPVSHNQYFVGVQYPETAIESMQDVLNIPITGSNQHKQVRLGDLAELRRGTIPSEIKHINIQPTIDVTMGVEGRDLGHVSDDLVAMLAKFGKPLGDGLWETFDPGSKKGDTLAGSRIVLSGEYARMRDTFKNLALGLVLATLLMYFLMTALFKSFVTPLVILSAVPVGGIGVVLMLYVTETPVNVQSLLGVIFMVGIVVSNTVLLTDFAQHLRVEEGLNPTEAIRKAASIRVRPVVMTALAAFFALVPMAMAFERGSEANAPLGRAVIGGLVAGLVTTLFLVPALYSLVVRGNPPAAEPQELPHHVGPGLAPAGGHA